MSGAIQTGTPGNDPASWLTLPAGRELDALVAEQVMGWRLGEWLFGTAVWWSGGPQEEMDWSPSTSIRAAWQVVEEMQCRDLNEWRAFRRILDEGDGLLYLSAETAPLAICRAALAAVGGSEA